MTSITEKTFRDYQEQADDAIYEELHTNNQRKCIVKMFCGSGKSLLMRKCKVVENLKAGELLVYVFPSLSLIDQFYVDYLSDFPRNNVLRISSEKDSTTDIEIIARFLENPNLLRPSESANIRFRIICITYHSYGTLLSLKPKIDLCIFDEAHHAVGETYQKLIFENDICEKQIFFTATPKNDNDIVMYDRYKLDAGMCGKLVYDYSYLRGINEGYLNPIDTRIDFYSDDTNNSIFESIARAVLTTGNNRVLTFHSDVNTERDTSVKLFAKTKEFQTAFEKVQKAEFPEIEKYKKISIIGLSSDIKNRTKILQDFDATAENEVMVIASCNTIGEGIDTKNANMCVFVDPKTSYVKIIQNIGRVVRKVFGVDKPNSTILIPCWVDKTKYAECGDDKEKTDEVIRQEMNKGGNFTGILNVLTALKQEDKDLYDICLNYPDTYSPQEIRSHLEKHGYAVDEQVGDGGLMETLEHLLDEDIDWEDYEDCDSTEEMIQQIAEDKDVCVEIYTHSLETPVKRYNSECESVVRLYKSEEEDVYSPVLKKDGLVKRNVDKVSKPNRANRLSVNTRANPDVKVLWNIVGEIDLSKDICSCVIDCEVVDRWYDKLEELKNFIDENKKRPLIFSINENEAKLARWVHTQNQNSKKKIQAMAYETKYNLWSKFVEEYRDYMKNNNYIWYETFNELKTFINENKKVPSSESKSEVVKELGSWMLRQINQYKNKKYGMKDKERYNLWTEFIEQYKEYFKSDDEIWYETFVEVKKFINENNKRPSVDSSNKTEKTLGSWISRQIHNYINKQGTMKHTINYNLWTEFIKQYKDYLKTKDEVWCDMFNELKQFISVNKTRPSRNHELEGLKNWLSDQNKYYKKKSQGMKDKVRYNLWTEFLHPRTFKTAQNTQ